MQIDRTYIISLKRRPDRLQRALDSWNQVKPPFPDPIIFNAVDGNEVPKPPTWKAGNGAWGCRNSHLAIFDQIFSDKLQNCLILEDDFEFVTGFNTKVEPFLNSVPYNYDSILLGGQHHRDPLPSPGSNSLLPPNGIKRVMASQRTHAYIIKNGFFMKQLYLAWQSTDNHIDWIMSKMHYKYNIFCPDNFLIGQSESRSDITNRDEERRLWSGEAFSSADGFRDNREED
jgi:GR25 family glycosyltransferase involved in LPS biosynthesis